MYTIKEAAARTGVPIALLRAWERRYRIVAPVRTTTGYRLYDEAALDQLRAMRSLVMDGWQPSAAAAAILAGTAPSAATARAEAPVPMRTAATGDGGTMLVTAAAALDPAGIERALDEMFAAGSFEAIAEGLLLPALVAIGNAWADGRVSVAGEHAASQAVQRRLSAAFQAAGRSPSGRGVVLVGLPPGSRHELGALAFAVAARRAGLPILYLGPDLPVADWITTAGRTRARAVVVGTPTAADIQPARRVLDGLREEAPATLVAVGGRGGRAVAESLGAGAPDVLVLPDGLTDAVDAVRSALGRGRGGAASA